MTRRSSQTPGPVRVRVPGKINLHLSVGDLRADGYHDLVTVFHAVDLVDELTISPAERHTVSTEGASAAVPTGGKNLAGAAARLLAKRTKAGGPVAIQISKQIPVAGGMAGGSADAAGALLGCAALWGLELTRDQLSEIAAELGSDVPFALAGGTAVGTGRGERLSPVLARTPLHWVLALADGGLSTPAVFAELDRLRSHADPPRVAGVQDMLTALSSGDPAQVGAALGNDLQAAAISLQPGLRRTLRAGLAAGALGGVVSGSGPTVALLCADPAAAAEVAAELAGSGTCRSVRVASGPAPGARVIG
ncbi:4-diphosphocytidyl-2-C-methyl-D-erythritol kinase [Nakamurella panacisegetis]|uniref:4-diphosphocytidyl-2-C-methyl-D-erythritol kinase n=1 Tax=Nakamurella panacisegetis TaxID=1090615 RepID=A0A1H0ILY2_9ACTN|nr:4-(cytidine 5'-diphospho)-2-C-methyl-D-erythritol kinase [Nakamurella panacisegetis]SDO32398.1 4-diphosphocytidyl-2-C-methyl-D-erythritol kinase [Nakamurella panacisegetis]